MPETTLQVPDPAHDAALALAAAQPAEPPQARLVWTAVVDVGPRQSLGPSGHGERFIVPICGGLFVGGPGYTLLEGVVCPGGADRQLLRPDGVKELHAVYEMRTTDGHTLTIDNRVIVDESVQPKRYALSRITVAAPQGPHAWLNRRLLVGTLDSLRPARDAVLIRAYVMTA